MNEIKIFENKDFGEIRTSVVNGEPYFCLADVCKALDINNVSQLKTRLNEGGVITNEVIDSLGRTQEATFINEPNLYKAIFQSRKPSAEKFTDWVTGEVLPSIRKTGGYQIPKTTGEQIKLIAQGYEELDTRVSAVERKTEEFENNLPLLAIDCQNITTAKNKVVVNLLGGIDSNAYKSKSLRSKVYKDLEGQLRREFNVTSYKAIKRKQLDKAVEIIKRYELPLFLKEAIDYENAQVSF